MPTQIGYLDLKSQNEARKTATNYIDYTPQTGVTIGYNGIINSKINLKGDGVRLYDENGDLGALLSSGGLDVYQEINSAPTSVASFGATARIGVADSSHAYMTVTDSGIQGYNAWQCILDIGLSGAQLPVTKTVVLDYVFPSNTTTSHAITELDDYLSNGDVFQLRFNSGFLSRPYYEFTYGTPQSYILGNITYDGANTIKVTGSSETVVDRLVYEVTEDAPAWTLGTRNLESTEGGYSYAEGFNVEASGSYSHAQNNNTIAQGQNQTAIGKYNIADSTSAFIIGNGASDSQRSNAFSVAFDGNVNIASGAHYKINGTNLSASDVGAVPTSRTVNGKALSSDITLGASDVSAVALSDKYTRSSTGGLDWTNQTDGDAKVIAKSALAFWNGTYNGTASNLAYCNKGAFGTLATKNSLSASDVGAVPTSRTVNSKALSSNITLSASDVGAFPKSNMTRGISMVSTIPSDGKLTLNNTDIGGSSSAKIQGVLAIPQYSNGVTVKHNYDASSTSQVVLNFYKADGSAYSGAMRYFLITFPDTWTP